VQQIFVYILQVTCHLLLKRSNFAHTNKKFHSLIIQSGLENLNILIVVLVGKQSKYCLIILYIKLTVHILGDINIKKNSDFV
jgi:hypothetical protein